MTLKHWFKYELRFWRPHKELKYLLQKLWYGFSEKDTWSLDIPFAKMILKGLKAFERWGFDDKYGYPAWLQMPGESSLHVMSLPDKYEWMEDQYNNTNKLVWTAIIYRLIDGFEHIAEGDSICVGYDEYAEDTLALFEQVYPSLWT